MDVHFNERFSWEGPTQLKEEYRDALVKGLPFPILTIVEYMAVDAEGFCWGRTYRHVWRQATFSLNKYCHFLYVVRRLGQTVSCSTRNG